MTSTHAAVWIDHHEAKIFDVDAGALDALRTLVLAPGRHVKRHPMRTAEPNHALDARHFHHDVAVALAGAKEILVVGPANAKLELVADWKRHDPAVAAKVVAIETVDHPTDGQIVALAKRCFKAADRMRGNA